MKKAFIAIFWVFIFIIRVHGQEGMWLLSQLGQLDLAKKGLLIPVDKVYNKDKECVANAVVQLGGGTASFVSKDGLLITNHHVAFGAIQRTSSVNSDYLANGFLATSRGDEIKAPGYTARLLLEMKDVTNEVLDAAKGITDPTEKNKKINEKIVQMTDAIEKGKEDISASVVQMYNGRQYIQFVHKLFKDIRIVYAPPSSIGNYGGETDNWMWPRHTGDFSFLRVYVAPDGTGKKYAQENVPYHPKTWLKVAPGFLKDGDFTFIIGYPGQTTRYRSSTSVHWNENYNYPFAVKNFKEVIALADKLTENNHEAEIKVASLKKGLANVMKNYQGKLDGMKKTNFYEKKLAFEKEFVKWANSNPDTKAKYGDILLKEKDEYKILEKTKDRDNVFGNLQGLAGTPLNIAQQLIYVAQQREKPEGEKDPGFSEETATQFSDGLEFTYANYFEPLDKALMVRTLKMANALPAGQRITGLEYIFINTSVPVSQFVDDAYKSTKLLEKDYVKTLFKKSQADLKALNDPFINIAFSIDPMAEEITNTTRTFGYNVTELRKIYLDGLYEWKGTGMYPDANSTIRFTWGKVKGYKPADAVWYDPMTTLEGMVAKNTGEDPFDAPKELVELYKKKDFGRFSDPTLRNVPIAFLNQCDITGGNSGSPVLNARGEIVGVAFDGNYESMISDWQYDYALQRCISVDMNYVLYVTEKIGKAGFLLDEMGVAR
ncbi:MAG: S46 family peptidase [bacterium]